MQKASTGSSKVVLPGKQKQNLKEKCIKSTCMESPKGVQSSLILICVLQGSELTYIPVDFYLRSWEKKNKRTIGISVVKAQLYMAFCRAEVFPPLFNCFPFFSTITEAICSAFL